MTSACTRRPRWLRHPAGTRSVSEPRFARRPSQQRVRDRIFCVFWACGAPPGTAVVGRWFGWRCGCGWWAPHPHQQPTDRPPNCGRAGQWRATARQTLPDPVHTPARTACPCPRGETVLTRSLVGSRRTPPVGSTLAAKQGSPRKMCQDLEPTITRCCVAAPTGCLRPLSTPLTPW